MKIAYNASAVRANNALFRNDQKLAQSLQRLSSGLKITSGKNNPSGLAMARRMNAQLEGIAVATQNASDAVSVIEIADGAMTEIHAILQRINELTIKACNETITPEDKAMIQEEIAALKAEITRISKTTEFNGQKILDGSFDLRGYSDNIEVKVTSYNDYVPAGGYQIDALTVYYDHNGNITLEAPAVPGDLGGLWTLDNDGNPDQQISAEITAADGNVITITGPRGFEIKLELRITEPPAITLPDPGDPPVPRIYAAAATPINLNLVGFGALDMQIGANEGQQLPIRIHRMSLENMGLANIDVSTDEGAKDALSKMVKAINFVSGARSHMGAYQNRLEHTISNLDITTENMTAAYSRIMDVDMAEEMTSYTTLQILSQASMTMLAQANERPAQVLQLLQ